MNEQTAMQQLLNQLRDERFNLPMHIAWDRCYQTIEMLIEKTYIEIEKEQILKAFWNGNTTDCISEQNYALEYYKETYKNK